ncbi:MAG: TIM barrel protein [Negativicutes bacterium]|jgi:deoxyribonuclease-4
MNKVYFGTAGNPDEFYESGKKRSEQMPEWLKNYNLSAYEYQCGRGVNVGEETARKIGVQAQIYGIRMSVHAPYFISLATTDDSTFENTKQHIFNSLRAAQWLGAYAVIFHVGGVGKQERSLAFELAQTRFAAIVKEAETLGLNEVLLAPETHGKVNQLGTIKEIIEFCKITDWTIPAIDFGHINSVGQGYIVDEIQYQGIFDELTQSLGADIASNIHIHFSQIEFTRAGEKKHHTFADGFGPPFEPLMRVIKKNNYTPTIICESNGTQAKDALAMQRYYESISNKPSY